MKIAILGWGSLIWDSRNLEIDKTIGQNGWYPDGPMLPIEFFRISSDGRLTLVIDPDAEKLQTLYSISQIEKLDHAILNLAVREGCGRNKIGCYSKDLKELLPYDFQFGQSIKSWIDDKQNIDAVIWTNLSVKLSYKNGGGIEVNVDKNKLTTYLKKISSNKQAMAEEYIRKAPISIFTPIRSAIEKELGWTIIV
ncbi:hypothetical protein [Aquipluma nitroreducens]|nr:hypothetical protein [Aquipluma nitroreducens]